MDIFRKSLQDRMQAAQTGVQPPQSAASTPPPPDNSLFLKKFSDEQRAAQNAQLARLLMQRGK